MDHLDPATGEVNGLVNLASETDIHNAIDHAKTGAEEWESLGPKKRRDVLGALVSEVEKRASEFQSLSSLEIGMPAKGFRDRLDFALEFIKTYQGYADKVGGNLTASDTNGRLEYTRYEPYGVIGAIMTWNSPLLSFAMKIPAVLAAGNAVVIKPSELTPFTPVLFGKCCLEAGVPPSAIHVLPGGIAAGKALIENPSVDKISFTGGTTAAAKMMQDGAPFVKPFCFELGGKSAHLIFPDSDLEKATNVICGQLLNAGQSCTFGSRIFIHHSVYDEFKNLLIRALDQIVVGDPQDEKTTMGPLINQQSRERILAMVDRALSSDRAKLVVGGEPPKLGQRYEKGAFLKPTVIEGVDPNSEIAQEEIFGPVMLLFKFDSEAEAVKEANNTKFGLSNFVHTKDLNTATRVAAQLKSGTVYVNGASRRNAEAPFGGFKTSGIGSEGGRPGLDEFLRIKTVGLV